MYTRSTKTLISSAARNIFARKLIYNMFNVLLIFVLVLFVGSTYQTVLKTVKLPQDDKTLIREWRAIISHDAATGELDQNRDGIIHDVKDAYSITQGQGLVQQLNCGSRALDYRPYLQDDGSIIAHHGKILVKKLMSESITEIQNYLADKEEFVLLYLSHYEGKNGCKEAVMKLLQDSKVPFIDDCSMLSSLTIQSAYSQGKLFAVFDCMDEQYDPSITCYNLDATCYTGSKHAEKPWDKFTAYITNATSHSPGINLLMQQAHWQSSAESVPLGLLHGSSVLLDESRSGMNKWVAANIANYQHIGLVELDNVCDNGEAVFNALQTLNAA